MKRKMKTLKQLVEEFPDLYTEWIPEGKMTEEQKKADPNFFVKNRFYGIKEYFPQFHPIRRTIK